MHKLVLSGIAALAALAILTGGRGQPAALGQASASVAHGRDVTMIALAAAKPWHQPAWTFSPRAGADTPR